jgi:hypothetical protein
MRCRSDKTPFVRNRRGPAGTEGRLARSRQGIIEGDLIVAERPSPMVEVMQERCSPMAGSRLGYPTGADCLVHRSMNSGEIDKH